MRERNKEKWRDISTLHNCNYSVSNFGLMKHNKTNRVLTPKPQNKLLYYRLQNNQGKLVALRICNIVWEAFNNKLIPKGHKVRHLDGDETNNDLSNLELYRTQYDITKEQTERKRQSAKIRTERHINLIMSKIKNGTETTIPTTGTNTKKDLTNEIWKQIPLSHYSISSYGRMRNDNTDTLLTPVRETYSNQYKCDFKQNGRKKNLYIKNVVYQLFIGDIPDGMKVVHKNKDCSDNRVDNLTLIDKGVYKYYSTRKIITPKCNNTDKPKYDNTDKLKYDNTDKHKKTLTQEEYNRRKKELDELRERLHARFDYAFKKWKEYVESQPMTKAEQMREERLKKKYEYCKDEDDLDNPFLDFI